MTTNVTDEPLWSTMLGLTDDQITVSIYTIDGREFRGQVGGLTSTTVQISDDEFDTVTVVALKHVTGVHYDRVARNNNGYYDHGGY